MNRIDEMIVFNTLTRENGIQIINKLLHELDLRLLQQSINIEYTDNLKNHILDEAFDSTYGARPLKRYIQKYIETYIATNIISSKIIPDKKYVLDFIRDELKLFEK